MRGHVSATEGLVSQRKPRALARERLFRRTLGSRPASRRGFVDCLLLLQQTLPQLGMPALGEQRLDGFQCGPARSQLGTPPHNLRLEPLACCPRLSGHVPGTGQPSGEGLDEGVVAIGVGGPLGLPLDRPFGVPGRRCCF